MPDDVDLGFAAKLPPREAIEFFRAKGYEVSWNWWEVYAAAHQRAFTVAKAIELDVLMSIRGALDRALEKGQTRRAFARDIEPTLRKLGWWGRKVVVDSDGGAEVMKLGTPHRLRTIYDSNMRSTYGAARLHQQRHNADSRPFWMYDARNDGRTRPSHAALDGAVFRHDDPFWASHYPPNGWNCRCRVRALTADQVRRRGLRVHDSAGSLTTVQQRVGTDKRTGEVIERPGTAYRFRGRDGEMHTLIPDAGWGSAPRGLPPTIVPPAAPPPAPSRPEFPQADLDSLEGRLDAAQRKYREWHNPGDRPAIDRAAADYRRAWDALPEPVLGADSAPARGARRRARDILDDADGVRRRGSMAEPIPRTGAQRAGAARRAQAAMEELVFRSRPVNRKWSERVELRDERWRGTVDEVSRMVDPVLLSRGRVRANREPGTRYDRRGWADRDAMRPDSTVHIPDSPRRHTGQSRPATVPHELGHAIENANDALFREAVAFLDRRTGGAPTRRLPGYGPDEIYRPGFDRMDNTDYAGKIYSAGNYLDGLERRGGNQHRFARLADGTPIGATEVISMGLELMHKDPLKFARKDPEWFDFILTRVLFRATM